MYFKSRAEAGRLLANKLKKYNSEHCAVVALTPGSILIGAQIAMKLHASLMLLLSDKINLPGETDPIAAMTTSTFTYNHMYSAGQLEEYVGDYHSFIEGQKLEKFHKLNKLMTDNGEINPKQLRHHVVILVSDALQTGMSLEVAADFLKPIKMKKLIVVTPIASVNAVDRMHLVGDEIFCLSVTENLMETDHYYNDNTIPDSMQIQTITHNISLNWQT
jgi:putative phosphoribosyl transferase